MITLITLRRAAAAVAALSLACGMSVAQAQPTTPAMGPATPAPMPSSSYMPAAPPPLGAPATAIPAAAMPSASIKQSSPAPAPTAVPSNAPFSPNAVPSLLPADQASQLPFPAYGTPAPASSARPIAGVPQVITLQQAILIAFARSPLLAEARAQVAIASAPIGLAQSALFPAITGTASSTRSYRLETATSTTTGGGVVTTPGGTGGTTTGTGTTTTTGAAGSVGPSYFTTNGLNATLSQLIFDGGHVAAEIRSARATQSAAIATYQRELQTVAYNTATAYYNALSAQRQTQVDLATVQLDQVQENLVSAQIQAGTAARTDLFTAQLPTAQARVAVVRSQANERVQLATFANTLGIDADAAVQPKDDIPALSATSGTLTVRPAFPTPSYAAALTRAFALRPDLTAAQQTVASYQANLRAQKLSNFPTINGSASYGTNSTDLAGGTYRPSGSLGATLTVPIYDRGVERAEVAQAQGQLDNAVAQLVFAQQSTQLGVRTALVNLVSAYAALDQTNAELAKAQQVLLSTEAQYRAGVTTLPLLLNAQVGITQALTDEVTAVYAVRQAEQALIYAEGVNVAN